MIDIPMGSDEMMMGWGGSYFGPVIMVGIIILIIFALFAFLRPQNNYQPGHKAPDNSMNILKERLAAGEISRAEFEETRKILERD